MLISSTHSFPFEYSLIQDFINYEHSLSLLDWLEKVPFWKLKSTGFYSQWEFRLDNNIILPDNLKFLTHVGFLNGLKTKLEKEFRAPLGKEIYIKFHKMVPFQEIKIHNDYLPEETAFRLVIQFNRGWTIEQGGYLIIHNNYEGEINRVLLPLHNTGIAFKISNSSLHSVSPILGGERYTLVYIFSQENENKDN
ncbi:cyclophane-containing peptide 2OG-Fe(II) oxygenase YhhC [Candidatus Odyssella acanthamoebae]|uniref:Prolyl 4-hydroxylase alpha subunit Fe(2+) 2OG dioxygenase domain-containing protein n=1 Tax=Candidatus Odyssella acanthamoebae TaxID=91604 RepID=A0A077AW17_9PROT|nr:cyclophane-containing peptide 2OG-Fe(II) oxygenase YhhC [Candidatus Paracaedibacter acanthamoebae]AIK96249.1 hypothetical protein ID47_05070 [Candidatus Paracaedibacter acanthamoebae]